MSEDCTARCRATYSDLNQHLANTDNLAPAGGIVESQLKATGHVHAVGNELGGMMAFSDLFTALAYFFIPAVLTLFIIKHRELKFKRILVMFILFILACGLQHFLHFTSHWYPTPQLLNATMAFMAAISVITAVMILPILRQVSAFIQERGELDEKLAAHNVELESALSLANDRKLAFEQSERAFRAIISGAPIGTAVVTLDGRFSLVNKALCDMFGYGARELEKLTFQEITHPDDLDTDLFQVRMLLDGVANNYRMEKRYIRRDGAEVQAQLDVSLVRDEQGNPDFFVSQIQDITASKQTQSALKESRHRFLSLLKHLPTAVVVHRSDSSIEYVNPAAEDMLGLTEDQLLGKSAVDPDWHFLTEDGDQMPLDDYPIMKVLSSKRPLSNYTTGVVQRKDAQVRWMLVNAFPIKTAAGALDQVIVSFIDITEHKKLQQALKEQAQTDPLTGLFNRRYFQETAAREVAQARRANSPLSIIELDLDHFKRINDRYGHAAGDKVLVAQSDIIRQLLRENDIPCRVGGEEFVIIMPGTDAHEAAFAAERLRAKVMSADIQLENQQILRWTTSLGVASLEDGDICIEDVIQRADRALYQAKADGRNCVSVAAMG